MKRRDFLSLSLAALWAGLPGATLAAESLPDVSVYLDPN